MRRRAGGRRTTSSDSARLAYAISRALPNHARHGRLVALMAPTPTKTRSGPPTRPTGAYLDSRRALERAREREQFTAIMNRPRGRKVAGGGSGSIKTGDAPVLTASAYRLPSSRFIPARSSDSLFPRQHRDQRSTGARVQPRRPSTRGVSVRAVAQTFPRARAARSASSARGMAGARRCACSASRPITTNAPPPLASPRSALLLPSVCAAPPSGRSSRGRRSRPGPLTARAPRS